MVTLKDIVANKSYPKFLKDTFPEIDPLNFDGNQSENSDYLRDGLKKLLKKKKGGKMKLDSPSPSKPKPYSR